MIFHCYAWFLCGHGKFWVVCVRVRVRACVCVCVLCSVLWEMWFVKQWECGPNPKKYNCESKQVKYV